MQKVLTICPAPSMWMYFVTPLCNSSDTHPTKHVAGIFWLHCCSDLFLSQKKHCLSIISNAIPPFKLFSRCNGKINYQIQHIHNFLSLAIVKADYTWFAWVSPLCWILHGTKFFGTDYMIKLKEQCIKTACFIMNIWKDVAAKCSTQPFLYYCIFNSSLILQMENTTQYIVD